MLNLDYLVSYAGALAIKLTFPVVLFKRIFISILCMWAFCLHVCMCDVCVRTCTHVCIHSFIFVHAPQPTSAGENVGSTGAKVTESWELLWRCSHETLVLGRVASAANHHASTPTPRLDFKERYLIIIQLQSWIFQKESLCVCQCFLSWVLGAILWERISASGHLGRENKSDWVASRKKVLCQAAAG